MSLSLPFVLDLCERTLLFLIFGWLCFRILTHMNGEWGIIDLWLLGSEGAATFFVLTHRFTDNVTLRVGDWILTLIAAYFPLLVVPSASPALFPIAICAALMAAGSLLQVMAKLTLRRSFGLAPANRGVKVGGPYRLLRHPMYAGYLMTHIAFFSVHPNPWNLVLYLTAFIAQCFRLLAEERVLSADSAYQEFMKSTRWRLIPYIF